MGAALVLQGAHAALQGFHQLLCDGQAQMTAFRLVLGVAQAFEDVVVEGTAGEAEANPICLAGGLHGHIHHQFSVAAMAYQGAHQVGEDLP